MLNNNGNSEEFLRVKKVVTCSLSKEATTLRQKVKKISFFSKKPKVFVVPVLKRGNRCAIVFVQGLLKRSLRYLISMIYGLKNA